MMNNITFGQYYNSGSVIHKADPRTKLLSLIAYIILIFVTKNFFGLAFLSVITVLFMLLSKVPLKMYLKNLKAILPIIILTAILNAFYSGGGQVLASFWIIKITTLGLQRAVFMALRVVLLIFASAILSYTTTPTALTNAIESLLKPLSLIGLGSAVHTMAMTMTIALRFIPTLIDETEKIMNAQKARGANLETGSLVTRVKALLPILIPLLISSVRRAYELAESMECRCYNGGKGRTKLNVLHYGFVDFAGFLILIISIAATVALNFIKF